MRLVGTTQISGFIFYYHVRCVSGRMKYDEKINDV